jgi:hydroxymethylpyrimidine/phosphomethylpyrimidine kinase
VLTIAGSDSGGGAGIQADLKTFLARGTYGMSVVTALTAQNTLGVQGIMEVPPQFVAQQLDSVFGDIRVDSVKIGMLANRDIIDCVAQKLREYSIGSIVVDPVMVATSGDVLLKSEAKDSLAKLLFPLATIVTPNIPEAIQLSNMKQITCVDEMVEAAKIIGGFKPKYVLVKGGHLPGVIDFGRAEVTDILYDVENDRTHLFKSDVVVSQNTHGTGCTLAACIAAEIGKGAGVVDAVSTAKQFMSEALKLSANVNIGKGHGPLMHHLMR